MAQNIWDVIAVTSLTDSDYFYVGINETGGLNKILKADVFSEITTAISAVEDLIPTKVSDLTNDSGYLTEHQSLDAYLTKAEAGATYALITDIPNVVSALTNDSGYVTQTELSAYDYIQQEDLEEAVSQVSITTDTTLSMSGHAADAAAVGEALNNITVKLDTDGAGQPVPIDNSDDMEDTSIMYLYLGDEEDYEYGYVYCYVNDEWTESINAYGTYAPDGATLSSTAISLLNTILSAATYSTDQTSNIAALIEELSS